MSLQVRGCRLNRQPSALNSTESMPTAHKFEGWGFLAATQASPGLPPSCADLSAERKLQPRAVAVKFLSLQVILRYLETRLFLTARSNSDVDVWSNS